jgi:hypothetical protein
VALGVMPDLRSRWSFADPKAASGAGRYALWHLATHAGGSMRVSSTRAATAAALLAGLAGLVVVGRLLPTTPSTRHPTTTGATATSGSATAPPTSPAIRVLDAVGQTLAKATTVMRAAGLQGGATDRDPQGPTAVVVAQEPPGGVLVPPGSVIGFGTRTDVQANDTPADCAWEAARPPRPTGWLRPIRRNTSSRWSWPCPAVSRLRSGWKPGPASACPCWTAPAMRLPASPPAGWSAAWSSSGRSKHRSRGCGRSASPSSRLCRRRSRSRSGSRRCDAAPHTRTLAVVSLRRRAPPEDLESVRRNCRPAALPRAAQAQHGGLSKRSGTSLRCTATLCELEHSGTPSATVAMLREQDNTVDYLVCQWPLGSPRIRSSKLPTGGHRVPR